MWPLPELQSRLADAILKGAFAEAAPAIEGDGLAPAARLQIYRNHLRITLADALAAIFPATVRLLGEPCFAGLARRYVAAHPPEAPCLFEYGEHFPAFLARRPELRQVAYAPDLARLEWTMHAAYHAPDAPTLTPERLSRLPAERVPELRLAFHPAWRLVGTRWPVLAIWAACQPGAMPEMLHLVPESMVVLVGRDRDGDVVRLRLAPGRAVFLRRLHAGRTLADAAADAAVRDPCFDLAGTLALSLEAGLFAAGAFHPNPC